MKKPAFTDAQMQALGLNPLDYEIVQEQAAALSRTSQRLTRALAALHEIDRSHAEYRARLAEAGEALWYLVIQREACGLRRHQALYEVYDIPNAVRLAMGPKGDTTRK